MRNVDVILIRHATAERSSATGADRDRALSASGEREARTVATRVARIATKDTVVLASPYLRAMQTAQAIADALQCTVTQERLLGADHSLDEFFDAMRPYTDAQLVVVGHMPTIGNAASAMIAEGIADLLIEPATMVGMNWRAKKRMAATLCWLIPPTSSDE